MGRPRTFDETEAVTRAAALFAQHGYEGTSVDDLVRGLGIHRGSLYSAFGSKRALYLRVLAGHVAELAGDQQPVDGTDLTLLLRAAVERAPVDDEAAVLVDRGLRTLERRLPAPPDTGTDAGTALAQLLGEHLIRRAGGTHHDQERP
jgi:TetR/AcrR family transcriptional regulator, transcriptional repressor for nem operon